MQKARKQREMAAAGNSRSAIYVIDISKATNSDAIRGTHTFCGEGQANGKVIAAKCVIMV